MAQTGISQQLVNDLDLLEEIVEGAANSGQTIQLCTSGTSQQVTRATINTTLTTHGVAITIDLNGTVLTFNSAISLDYTTVTDGVAEALDIIATAMASAATEIATIASTKYP